MFEVSDAGYHQVLCVPLQALCDLPHQWLRLSGWEYQQVVCVLLQAQCHLLEQQSQATERSLLLQLEQVREERDSCLESATRADALLSRLGVDQKHRPSSPSARVSAAARTTRVFADRSSSSYADVRHDAGTAAVQSAAELGSALLRLKGLQLYDKEPKATSR